MTCPHISTFSRLLHIMFFLRLYYALLFLIVEHASTEASTSFLNDEAGSLSLNDNFFFAKDDIASSNDIIYSNDNLFPDPKDTSTIFDNNLSLAESLCSDPNEHLNNNLQIRQFCANPSQSSPTTPTIPKLPDLDDIENAVNQPPNSETDSKTDSATDPDIEILVQVEEPTRPEAPFRVGNNDVGRAMSESEPEYYCHGWDANSYFIPVCASSNPIDRIKTKPDVYDELRNSKLRQSFGFFSTPAFLPPSLALPCHSVVSYISPIIN